MDWEAASLRLIAILKERTGEIRRDISSDRILESVRGDILASGVGPEFKDFPEGTQMEMLETLLLGINEDHKKRIRVFVEGVGSIVDGSVLDGDSFSGEDESHVFVNFERMRVKLEKDVALKIVALGYVPAGS